MIPCRMDVYLTQYHDIQSQQTHRSLTRARRRLELRKRSQRHCHPKTDLKRHLLPHSPMQVDPFHIFLESIQRKNIIPIHRRPLSHQPLPHPTPKDIKEHTSTATTPIPSNTTNALENALNPTPTSNPSTLPRLTWRIVRAVSRWRVVVPCFRMRGSWSRLQCVAAPTGESVREYGAVYWHCRGVDRRGKDGCRTERLRPRPIPRVVVVLGRRNVIVGYCVAES